MSIFAPKSPCCGAPIEMRTDGPGGIGRTIDFCSKCDMAVPTSLARAPDVRPPAAPSPPAAPAPPRRVPPAEPPTSEPAVPSTTIAKAFSKKCARSGRPYTATGAAQKWCGTCPECKKAASGPPPRAKAKPDAPAPRRPANTGFRAEPAKGGKNMYQPTIDALREEYDALDERRKNLVTAIAHLEQLGVSGG